MEKTEEGLLVSLITEPTKAQIPKTPVKQAKSEKSLDDRIQEIIKDETSKFIIRSYIQKSLDEHFKPELQLFLSSQFNMPLKDIDEVNYKKLLISLSEKLTKKLH